jgi:hypothetical protein
MISTTQLGASTPLMITKAMETGFGHDTPNQPRQTACAVIPVGLIQGSLGLHWGAAWKNA